MKSYILYLLLLLFPVSVFCQWSTFVFNNQTSRILPTDDGGSFIPGWAEGYLHFTKLDRFGKIQWHRNFPLTGEYIAVDAVEHPDGRFTVLIRYNFQTENTNLLQMDAYGNVLWHKTMDNGGLFCRAYRIIRTQDDGFLVGVSTDAVYEKRIYKTDAAGSVQFIYFPSGDIAGYHLEDIRQTPDNQYEAVYQNGYVGNLLKIVRFSEQGVDISSDTAQNSYQYGNILVSPAGPNQYLCVGTSSQATQLYATLFTNQGELVWEKPLGLPYPDGLANESLKSVVVLNDGTFIIVRSLGLISRFNKFDADGNPLWERTFSRSINSLNNFPVGGVSAAADGSLLVAAKLYLDGNDLDILAFNITPAGKTRLNQVEGTVLLDSNLDCAIGSEPALKNWQVELRKPGDTIVVNTTEFGFYRTSIDTGMYEIRVVPINNLWENCPTTAMVNNTIDQLVVQRQDFAVQPATLCPRIEVDITAPFLRRCFSGQYFIKCYNAGTKIADTTGIAILLDPYLTYDTASLALASQRGDTLFFNLGILEVGQSKSFSVSFTVNCDSTTIGQTHCTKAMAFPNQLCSSIDPTWSGASLDISGHCMGDSVAFDLKNNGVGSMLVPAELQLIRDEMLYSTLTYQLAANQSQLIAIPADGSTWRLQTQQVTGHPFYGVVSSTVEGCIAGSGQNFTTGFVTLFPTEDASPFVSIDCQDNIGSFDPNDKNVTPRGRGNTHLVAPNTDLEYIVRFQNTGSDTAFNIIIRDTLSAALSPYSLIPGAASHLYTWGYDAPRSIYFSFKNILLPDSIVNEAGSHGFISYSVKQLPNNPENTEIHNRAGIYFDFNPPVITNTTYLTVSTDAVSGSIEPIRWPAEQFSIAPNPADNSILILGPENSRDVNKIEVDIHSLTGRHLFHSQLYYTPKISIPVNQLPNGIYFITITQAGVFTYTKKLIVVHSGN